MTSSLTIANLKEISLIWRCYLPSKVDCHSLKTSGVYLFIYLFIYWTLPLPLRQESHYSKTQLQWSPYI